MIARKIKFIVLLVGLYSPLAATPSQTLGSVSHALSGLMSGETSAIVRASTYLCPQEKDFLRQRRPIARQALSQFVGQQLSVDEVPTIAIAGSGGGYRAMLATAGTLLACQDVGLLDGATYLAGVSGSTWLLGPWYASGLPLEQHLAHVIPEIVQDARTKDLNYPLVTKCLLKKLMFGQQISLIDLFGAALAHTFLHGKDRYEVTLSSTQRQVQDGTWPFPICSAIEGNKPYDWYEFTPYEVGNQETNCYIPSWALGRMFDGGVSHDFAPEPSLGYLLGVFGAVMSASFEEVYLAYASQIEKVALQSLILELLGGPGTGSDRLFEARVANFAYRMPYNFSAFKEELTFVDSGFSCNIPLPALLGKRRGIDVIIVADASSEIETGSELRRTIAYAHRKKLPLPTIDVDATAKNHVQVYDDNPDAPIIIYLPYIKNDGYDANFDPQAESIDGFCTSSSMAYTEQQSRQVIGLAKHNAKVCMPAIKEAIALAITRTREKMS